MLVTAPERPAREQEIGDDVRLVLPRLAGSRRRVALLVGALAVAGVGTAWAMSRDDASSATTTTTATAAVSTVEDTISTTGTLRAAREAEHGFSAAGTVTSVAASVGQVVTTGQVLATIDDAALRRAVTTAEASVEAAQKSLKSLEDGDASDTQIAAAQSQLAAAQSDLDNAREALAGASLTSTIGGTVAAVELAVGDRVGTSSASPSSGGGVSELGAAVGGQTTTAQGNTSQSTGSSGSVTVISTDAFVVDASVGSSDLGRLTTGLQARITPTGSTERAFGTLSSVGVVATSSSSGAATFPVTIDVTGTPVGLYAGGGVSVEIVVSQTPDVLTVPTQAITTTDDGTTVVRKVVDGAEVDIAVTVGTSYGPTTQITDGLAEGDTVAMTATTGGPGARPGGGGQSGGQGGFPPDGFPGGGQLPPGGFPGAGGAG